MTILKFTDVANPDGTINLPPTTDPDPRLWYLQLVEASHEFNAVRQKLRRLANDRQHPESAAMLRQFITDFNWATDDNLDRFVDDLSTAYQW